MMKNEVNKNTKNYRVKFVDSKKKNNKKKDNKTVKAARQYVAPKEIRAGNEFEYKMPIAVYDDILKECKKDGGGDAQTYLCNWVNEQFGLLGTCVRVIPS